MSKKSTAKVAAPTTVAVAPAHPEGQGKANAGGHVKAWRNQPSFAVTAKLSLVSPVNPWRPGTPGHKFWPVLQEAKTVQQAIDNAAKIGLTARQVQGHLRWLYTWGGAYLQVDGALYQSK